MSPRGFRITVILFLLLSGGMAANLMLFQPTNGRGVVAGARVPSPFETSALKAEETSTKLRGEVLPQNVLRVTAPDLVTGPAEVKPKENAETIRAIQRELQARGYDAGNPDGMAGLVTQAAIMAFETDHGIVLTGEATDELLQAILLGGSAAQRNAGRAQQSARASQVIRTVQQSLSKLGYDAGKADGQLGESTINAIRAFEKQQGLADSGRISGPLVARLMRLAAEKRLAVTR
jgi:peptidoglycan hydrolase-like protein with peptidoglycan-binding domain